MRTLRNSYFITRVMVWLRAGSIPSVTLASSTLQVHELAYRTSPARHEWISRRYSRTVDLETFAVDREMLDRIRLVMTHVFAAACRDGGDSARRDSADSKWFFQPRDDGWFAIYDGKPNDIRAFRRWLDELLS